MKIFYMSCHSVHEFDEVRMFHKLGYDIFSPAAYYNPQNDEQYLRPGIEGLHYKEEDIINYNNLYNEKSHYPDGKDNLTKEFLKDFDVVFVMSLADRWIVNQWDVLKDKIVVWRTNGQSNSSQELNIKQIKDKFPNLKIARYSPTERTMHNYAGEDALIRFGKRPDEYCDWNGNINKMITICQDMKGRSNSCSWNIFKQLADQFPSSLYGHANENNEYWIGKTLKTKDLLNVYRDNRVYFYAGTKPANYTLNFIESWMTGMPIVAVGPKTGNENGYDTYETHKLIENGVDGFVSDDINELKNYITLLMNDYDLCKKISENARKSALKYFNEYDKEIEWKNFFNSL